jgi:hypothetical protein
MSKSIIATKKINYSIPNGFSRMAEQMGNYRPKSIPASKININAEPINIPANWLEKESIINIGGWTISTLPMADNYYLKVSGKYITINNPELSCKGTWKNAGMSGMVVRFDNDNILEEGDYNLCIK